MKLVSIQGGRARGLYFKDETRRVLFRKLRSFLDRRFLLINSPFKTDLLYECEEDYNTYIIKLFYEHKGVTFHDKYINYFFRSAVARETFENYFGRILTLQQSWQREYLDELARTVIANPENPILQKIIDCYSHFDVEKYTVHFPTKKGRRRIKVTPDNARTLVMRLLATAQPN